MKRGLCWSCTYFSYAKTGNSLVVDCDFFGKIKAVATECSKYYDKSSTDLRMMEQSAWILESKKKPGFDTAPYEPTFQKPDPEKKLTPIHEMDY